MTFRKILVGTIAGAVAVGLSVAPASAHKDRSDHWGPGKGAFNRNATALKFSPQVREALQRSDFVVEAVAPGRQWNSLMFSFPAQRADKYTVTHTGGLTFSGSGQAVTLSDFVFDLKARTVDVTVAGVGPVQDALTLQYVRSNKRLVKAGLTVNADQAAALNALLGVDLFVRGQYVGRVITKLGSNGWDCWSRGGHYGRWDNDRAGWDRWDRWFRKAGRTHHGR